MALAYYGSRISPHMTETPEGYLICHDVPISRTGDQSYTARELQLDGDPERVVTVHRYPEDVFDAATIASFEGKDVTAGHPSESVGAENHAAYSKGHVQNVRRVGEQTMGDLHIKDAGLISDIKNGVVREVSCGYLCNYAPDGDGYRQTHIRGNHVAVVPRGRAGHEVAIKDSAETAEKGRKYMSKFTEAILSAFGMAAKEANPEDLGALVTTAATALDAAPAELAPEAKPAEDVMVERAPKGDDLGSKLDKVIEMLASLEHKNDREEKKLSDEDDLDKEIARLTVPEGAVTIPAEEMEDTPAESRDAALELLKRMRPAVAAIQDKKERACVTDALLSSIKGNNVMGDIMKAAQASATKAADAKKNSYEEVCRDQKSVYDARNPHKKKEA